MSDSPHVTELGTLIGALLDRTITPEQMATLAERIRTDESVADRVAELMLLSSDTGELLNSERGTRSAERAEPRSGIVAHSALRVSRFVLPLAAVLLLAAAVVAIRIVAFNLKPETSNSKLSAVPIATVLETSGDATVIVNDDIASPGQTIRTGEVSLDTGSADFRLHNGVEVRLTGSARLTIHDSMAATVTRGFVAFHCPPSVSGYTVYLPHGVRVIDTGTAFTVDVDDAGAHLIAVTEGSVLVRTADGVQTAHAVSDVVAIDRLGHRIAAPDQSAVVTPAEPGPAPATASAAYDAAVLADRPLAYWRFDQVGQTVVPSRAAEPLSIHLRGQAAVTADRVLRLTGPDAWVEAPGVAPLIDSAVCSIELWVKPDHVQLGSLICLDTSLHLGLTGVGPSRTWPAQHIRLLHRTVGNSDTAGDNLYAPYPVGGWLHLVAVIDGNSMTLYVDGAPVAPPTRITPLDRPFTSMALGRLATKPVGNRYARPLTGDLHAVAIYNHALSADQVRAHHRAALAAPADTISAELVPADDPPKKEDR